MQENEWRYEGKKQVYRVQGQGPAVVLLHGFGEDGAIWKNQFELFPGNTLVVPDLPGSGQSEAVDDMSMEGLANAIKALLETVLPGQRVTIIGHSMGGYVTLAFAERYPEVLCAFGLFHSTAFSDSEEKKETRQKGIRFIRQHGAGAFLKSVTPNLYAPKAKEAHPEWIDEHLRQAYNFSAENLVSYYMAMIERPDRTAVLRETKVPVLFVLGQHDTAVPLQDGLQQCYLPQIAYIHILEQSAHMGMIEEVGAVAQILSQFVITTQKIA